MSTDKFLNFKGLKQYDPGMGWAAVHNLSELAPLPPQTMLQQSQASDSSDEDNELKQALENARRQAGHSSAEVLHDPLLGELFDQLNQPPKDELAQQWKLIAHSVNQLSQRMGQQRELRQHLVQIEEELDSLRQTILHDLKEIQRASDHQLSMARLRAEVSSLAQARLSSRLRNTPT
jgi:transposase